MHILITGAAGMIGRKLTTKLVKTGYLNGKPITHLTLVDVVPFEKFLGFSGSVATLNIDLSTPGSATKALAT
jgi:D-erythronate 2-dehydrogenase